MMPVCSGWGAVGTTLVLFDGVFPACLYLLARASGVEGFEVVYFANAAFLVVALAGATAGAIGAMCILPDAYRPNGTTGKAIVKELVGSVFLGLLGSSVLAIPWVAYVVPLSELPLFGACFVSGFAGPAAARYALPIGKRFMDWYAESKMKGKP